MIKQLIKRKLGVLRIISLFKRVKSVSELTSQYNAVIGSAILRGSRAELTNNDPNNGQTLSSRNTREMLKV